MPVASALGELRRRFEETDRTTGEVVVSWIRVGMGISMVTILATGYPLDHYAAAAWTVLLSACVYSWAALVEVAREAKRGKVHPSTAHILTVCDAGIIVVLIGLTSPTRSPMLPILVLVVITQGMRFPLRRAMAVVLITVVALVSVILLVPKPDLPQDERVRQALWWTWMLVSGGVLSCVLSYTADQAHRRRARAEAAAEAEHRRLDEEREVRRRLEAIDAARKDFLHALSHDFRTPIASLEALAEALRWERNPLSAEQRDEVIGLIGTHARQLGTMLGEVREVAITESLDFDQRVEIADVYMPELISSAVAAAGLSPERVRISIDPGLKVLHTDTRKVLRILANLLENANRYSPAQEGVAVRLAMRQEMVELAVLDRGPGIPPELTAQALEKFVSFGEHRSSGLGMWIVSQFVAALSGQLVVDARPEGGLIVRVRLPVEVRVRHVGAAPQNAAAQHATPRDAAAV